MARPSEKQKDIANVSTKRGEKNMKATFRTSVMPNGAVRYSIIMNGKTQSTYIGGPGYLRTEQEALTEAINECNRINSAMHISSDGDFGLIVGSALRYALPRHSYIVSTVADFIERYWNTPSVRRQQNIILRDIKEFLDERNENDEMFGGMDYRTWQNLYNKLTNKEDSHHTL